jgi:DNA-binding transcriptional LysR family regulator
MFMAMKDMPLHEFCSARSQAQVAEVLGWTQSAVSQAIRSGRDIRIVEHDAGAPVRVEPVTSEAA